MLLQKKYSTIFFEIHVMPAEIFKRVLWIENISKVISITISSTFTHTYTVKGIKHPNPSPTRNTTPNSSQPVCCNLYCNFSYVIAIWCILPPQGSRNPEVAVRHVPGTERSHSRQRQGQRDWWPSRVRVVSWWRHQMETALLALCAGNSPVTGEFPAQRPVTRGFGVFFDLSLNNGWVNDREAGDLRRHRAHYDVTVVLRAVV